MKLVSSTWLALHRAWHISNRSWGRSKGCSSDCTAGPSSLVPHQIGQKTASTLNVPQAGFSKILKLPFAGYWRLVNCPEKKYCQSAIHQGQTIEECWRWPGFLVGYPSWLWSQTYLVAFGLWHLFIFQLIQAHVYTLGIGIPKPPPGGCTSQREAVGS